MADVREDILARLIAVAGTIPAIRSVYRNHMEVDETQLPAAIVLDGDEQTSDHTDATMRPPERPTLATMNPAIVLLAQSINVGPDLTDLRRQLLKAILFDLPLNQIVGTGRQGNGAIRYLGCLTGIGQLRTQHGALELQLMFKYVLRPSDL